MANAADEVPQVKAKLLTGQTVQTDDTVTLIDGTTAEGAGQGKSSRHDEMVGRAGRRIALYFSQKMTANFGSIYSTDNEIDIVKMGWRRIGAK